MIALTKPIKRKTARPFMHYRRTIVVELLPGDVISLRLHGCRKSTAWSLHDLYYSGVRRDVARAKAERKKARKKKL
jgi:hypothetical protein